MKAPAFQYYPGEYLSSMRVQMMTLEEEGAYWRLISFCWLQGSLPSDPDALAKIIGKGATPELAGRVAQMFTKNRAGKLTHDRLEAERRKQKLWRDKSSEGGKKSSLRASKLRTQDPAIKQPEQGCLSNGTNQTSTLLSSVLSLQSSDCGHQSETRTAADREIKRLAVHLQTPACIEVWEGWVKWWAETFNNGRAMSFYTADEHMRILSTLTEIDAIAWMRTSIGARLRQPAAPRANGTTHAPAETKDNYREV